ncbi:DUF302 domain-containing protein [Methylocapsa polymorpha]|uniref:DUF302 domain-containing protein n=1 Tax=Methylocapsa polymorpha TaxID=3080828 RepID=A0ABZ0HTU3_9HYPH|nr:DUF302 domain-containing protein [Methylocapsa sp. RX1]
MPDDGLLTLPSAHSIDETISRFEAALKAHSVTLFAKIDHAAGAADANMPLRPTVLLIFGNPQAGTPLMQANQEIGIDLPLKALVWQDADGKVWLTYNDPAWLAARHQLGSAVDPVVAALGDALAALGEAAAIP